MASVERMAIGWIVRGGHRRYDQLGELLTGLGVLGSGRSMELQTPQRDDAL